MNKNVFTITVEVRFRDLDAMGHVNNAVYFTYFEEGRKSLFQKISKSSDTSAFNFILAHVSCDYLKPVKLDSRLSLRMWVSEVGRKRFNLKYRLIDMTDESVIYATGESVQVCFDYREHRSVEVSEALKAKLLEYQEADE
ncbi:MAG TPA: acyl-CoA thioesterase [Desulfobacterales bacterium]|nr:acyl-CoA thioesterase [Desulfobacterales bacterium]